MPEERRCDLCKHEKDLPCIGKNCNSANGLKCFEPKGAEIEIIGCRKCEHWKAVGIGDFCPDCGEKL